MLSRYLTQGTDVKQVIDNVKEEEVKSGEVNEIMLRQPEVAMAEVRVVHKRDEVIIDTIKRAPVIEESSEEEEGEKMLLDLPMIADDSD